MDGATVTELGTRVDPAAEIRVDGRLVRAEAPRYILLNKPSGFITTTSDEKGRDTVMSLVPARERVYPVGRLDRETEGLLLLTNDGDVAHRVMHPRYKLAKEYTVLTPSRPSEAVMSRVRAGVSIDRRSVVPDEFRILRETRDGVLLTITVHEGLNRVVRRMMEEVGIPIARLRRVRIGPLALGSIPLGGWRELTGGELTSLLQSLRLDTAETSHVGAATKSGRPKPVARGRSKRTAAAGRVVVGSADRGGDGKAAETGTASGSADQPGRPTGVRDRSRRQSGPGEPRKADRGQGDGFREAGGRSGSPSGRPRPARPNRRDGGSRNGDPGLRRDDQSGRRRSYPAPADGGESQPGSGGSGYGRGRPPRGTRGRSGDTERGDRD